MNRVATNKILEMCEDGVLDWKSLAEECLQRMSEDDVKEMGEDIGWLDDEEDEEEDEEDIEY